MDLRSGLKSNSASFETVVRACPGCLHSDHVWRGVDNTEREVVPLLGFRHITGVKRWDPFSRATYVSKLIDEGAPFSEVELLVGDATSAVKKLYNAHVVYNQIVEDLDMDGEPVRQSYSLLEVALGQAPIKAYIGAPSRLPKERVEKVVPLDRLEQLHNLVSFVFGDKKSGQERIITDSRQITQKLAPCWPCRKPPSHLEETRDLEGAYEWSERYALLRGRLTRGFLGSALSREGYHMRTESQKQPGSSSSEGSSFTTTALSSWTAPSSNGARQQPIPGFFTSFWWDSRWATSLGFGGASGLEDGLEPSRADRSLPRPRQ